MKINITNQLDTEGKVIDQIAEVISETITTDTETLSQTEWLKKKERVELLIKPLQKELDDINEILSKFTFALGTK